MLDKLSGSSTIMLSNTINTDNKREAKEEMDLSDDIIAQVGQTKEMTEKIVNSMNQFLKASSTHLRFEFHEELKEYYVSIVDNNTQEVVKEIPPKKLLDMYAAMTNFLGLLVDKKI